MKLDNMNLFDNEPLYFEKQPFSDQPFMPGLYY